MKKISLFVLTLLVLTVLSACSSDKSAEVAVKVYVMESSDDVMKPSLTLKDDGTCTFIYSGLSSYLPVGSYEINSNVLSMSTEDGRNIYVFDIRSGKLYFSESKSSPLPEFANVPDGSEFK